MRNNIDFAKKTIKLAAGRVPPKARLRLRHALGGAIVTDPAAIPAAQKKKLDLLIGKYIKKE